MKPLAASLCTPLLLAAAAAAAQPVSVTARPVAELAVVQSFRAPAEVVSLNHSPLSSEVEGAIAAVHADVGAVVAKGDPLVTLDCTDLELAADRIEADIAANQARIEQAELRLGRARNLSKSRFVSEDELLTRETELRVLRAELRRNRVGLRVARRDIDRCVIRAPFEGVVSARQAQVGGFVRRGDLVVTLTDIRRFELEVEVPADSLDSLSKATVTRFVVDDSTWPVRLERLSPVIESGMRVSLARYRFEGPAPPIGTSGELRWELGGAAVPADLLVRRDGVLGVFVVDGGTARFTPLPRAQEGRPAVHALAPDAWVVTAGRERLQDGQAVRVVSQ